MRRAAARLIGAIGGGAVFGTATLVACPVCFQASDSPTAAGVRAAVLTLAGVTICVLAGFAIWGRRLVGGRSPFPQKQGKKGQSSLSEKLVKGALSLFALFLWKRAPSP